MQELKRIFKSPHIYLVLILSWTVCLWVHLAQIQDLTDHELDKYWPGFSLSTLYQYPHFLNDLESNGILAQAFYRLIWFGEDAPCDALTLRLPVMVCALISLVLIYRLGKSLDGYRLGLCATFVLTTNTLQTGFAVHCRFYAFNTVMVILSTMLLLKMCQDERPRWRWLYMLSLLGCTCTMILSIFIVVPHLIYYIFTSRSRFRALKQAFLIALAVALCFGYLCYRDPEAVSRFNYGHSFEISLKACTCVLLSHGLPLGSCQLVDFYGNNHDYWAPYLWRAIYFNSALVGAVFLALLYDCLRRRQLTPKFLIVFILLMLYALMILESITIKNVLIPSNLAPIIPFCAMTVAIGLTPRPVRIFMLVCLLLGSHVLCNGTILDGKGPNSLTRIMHAHMHPGDIALIASDKYTRHIFPEAFPIVPTKKGHSSLAIAYLDKINNCPPGSKVLIPSHSLCGNAFFLLDRPHDYARVWFLERRDDPCPTAILNRFYQANEDGRCAILMRSNERYNLYLIKFYDSSSPATTHSGH